MRNRPSGFWGLADYSDDDLRPWATHPLMGQLDAWQVAWEGGEVVGGAR